MNAITPPCDLGTTLDRVRLTVTPPLPEDAQASAQIKGRARFENFIETLGRRLQKGQSVLREVPEDVDWQELSTSDGENEAL